MEKHMTKIKDVSTPSKTGLFMQPFFTENDVHDSLDLRDRLNEIFGTQEDNLAHTLFINTITAINGSNVSDYEFVNDILKLLYGFNARNSVESLLIMQIVVAFFRSMDLYEKTKGKEFDELGVTALKQAMDLSRLSTKTFEVLLRYRRQDQQQMVMEGVNVHGDGQGGGPG